MTARRKTNDKIKLNGQQGGQYRNKKQQYDTNITQFKKLLNLEKSNVPSRLLKNESGNAFEILTTRL